MHCPTKRKKLQTATVHVMLLWDFCLNSSCNGNSWSKLLNDRMLNPHQEERFLLKIDKKY